ncbi:hypothetical protein H9P43_000526 [Blastocladiella emersonii ATCC 22665]|nr:hypothetical protein H9P43_000526 [Blastocladiella emersonii ATCC 22665]
MEQTTESPRKEVVKLTRPASSPPGSPQSPKRRRTEASPASKVSSGPSATAETAEPAKEPLRVLEFYSGIGGMQYALNTAGVDAKVLAAFEVNDFANAVYAHNFGKGVVVQGLIEGQSVAQFEKHGADLWTMSPPCQPFSRQLTAKQEGSSDPRSKSFFYMLDVLRKLERKPRYLLVENVKGFDESDARDVLVATLTELGYHTREFLLNPLQIGIPNSRLRYYLVARLGVPFALPPAPAREFKDASNEPEVLVDGVPLHQAETVPVGLAKPTKDPAVTATTPAGVWDVFPGRADVPREAVREVREFLEPAKAEAQAWKDAVVWKRTPLFDIVTPGYRRSCCFTKNYYTYFEGTGSVLQENEAMVVQDVWPTFLERQPTALAQIARKEAVTEVENPLVPLRLRYFTPREVANLMCFPPEFSFPDRITLKQRYRLLGNSINVRVVAELLKFVLDPSS